MALRLLPRRTGATTCQRGSGTAIGVAIIFPMLLLVIVLLQSITVTTRTEQALQAVADRAAHSASLCCLHVADANEAARRSIEAHAFAGSGHLLECANNVAAEATIVIRDIAADVIGADDGAGNPNAVPSGGSVSVDLFCRLPANVGGRVFGASVIRSAVGVATIDPGRHRSVAVTP